MCDFLSSTFYTIYYELLNSVMLLFSQSSRRFRSMLDQRKNLPAWQEKENILDQLDQCQVLVVSGMTGWVAQSSTK